MAALVCSIQVASNWLGRPLKKTTLGIEHIYIIAKILFRAKQILKIARDFEPALGEPRRARRAAKSMGGAVRRPRNGWSKIRKSNLGVYL